MTTFSKSNPMPWKLEKQGRTYRIGTPDLLTAPEASALATILQQNCQDTELDRVVVDFSQTTFMDGMGLSALVAGYKLSAEAGLNFILSHVSSPVMLLLSITGLNRVFTIDETA